MAEILNVTPQMVGLYFCGKYRAPERLPEVLRELVGDDAAHDVLARIPERHPRATA